MSFSSSWYQNFSRREHSNITIIVSIFKLNGLINPLDRIILFFSLLKNMGLLNLFKPRCLIYFADAVRKWCTIFECYIFFASAFLSAAFTPVPVVAIVHLLDKYVHVTIVTETWSQHFCHELDMTICVIFPKRFIIPANRSFCPKFGWLVISVVQQIYDLLVLHSTIIYCCFSGDMYICTDFFVCIFGCTDFESSQVLFIAAFLILSTVLFPTKSLVASAAFWVSFFETVLRTSLPIFL